MAPTSTKHRKRHSKPDDFTEDTARTDAACADLTEKIAALVTRNLPDRGTASTAGCENQTSLDSKATVGETATTKSSEQALEWEAFRKLTSQQTASHAMVMSTAFLIQQVLSYTGTIPAECTEALRLQMSLLPQSSRSNATKRGLIDRARQILDPNANLSEEARMPGDAETEELAIAAGKMCIAWAQKLEDSNNTVYETRKRPKKATQHRGGWLWKG